MTWLQYAHFALAGGRPHVRVVVWRRQLAQVAGVLAKGSSCPTVAVTTRISARLTAQANARQASHNGSLGTARAISERLSSVPYGRL